MQTLVKTLPFTVPTKYLQEYYAILENEYQHLDWSWAKCGDTIVEQWRTAAYQNPANLLTHGWAIQSNLVDLSLPCPPWNISTLPTTEYRNTELAFGIVARLQATIPYAYRWSVSVQPPGGLVSLHSDQEDESTVWIPIYVNESPCITFVDQDIEQPVHLTANGSAYLFDTTVPHYTFNQGTTDRVTLIFRINKRYEQNLFDIESI